MYVCIYIYVYIYILVCIYIYKFKKGPPFFDGKLLDRATGHWVFPAAHSSAEEEQVDWPPPSEVPRLAADLKL